MLKVYRKNTGENAVLKNFSFSGLSWLHKFRAYNLKPKRKLNKIKFFSINICHSSRNLIANFDYRQVKYLFKPHATKWYPVVGFSILVLLYIVIQTQTHLGIQQASRLKRNLIGPWQYSAGVGPKMIASFAKNFSQAKVKVAREKSSLEFVLPIANPQITTAPNQLTYTSIGKTHQLKYQMLNNGIKEEIILYQKPTSNVITSQLKLNNLEGKAINNTPVFVDNQGNYQFHFERPFIADAAGNTSYNVTYKFIKQKISILSNILGDQDQNKNDHFTPRLELLNPEGQNFEPSDVYTLEIQIDQNWLDDPARVYPLTMDPTVLHDTSSEFAGIHNLTADSGSGSSPQIESYFQESATDDNTIALWHLNEGALDGCTGGEDSCDSSGNNYDLVETGTITQGAALINNGITLNGSSQYLTCTDANCGGTGKRDLDIDGHDTTFEFWINPNTITNGDDIISKGTTTGFNIYFNASNSISFQLDAVSELVGTQPISTGTWTHVAIVLNDTQNIASLYINGELSLTDTTATTVPTNAATLFCLGGEVTGASTCAGQFDGQFDEVKISNVVRTPEEIKADAQHRPWAIYTSDVIDLGEQYVMSFDNLYWTANGISTGDGETATASATANLIAQWNFNETSGTAANNDAEGTSCGGTPANCDGTLTTFTNTTGQDVATVSGWTADNLRWGAGALMFDGTNDTVIIGSESTFDFERTDAFSLEVWLNSMNSTAGIILGKMANTAPYTGYNFFLSAAGLPSVYLINTWTTNVLYVNSNIPVNDGDWHHVVFTYDGSSSASGAHIYVDGVDQVLTTTYNTLSASILNNVSFYAGSRNNTTMYFDGSLDVTRVYDKNLTASEVLSNYNASRMEFQTRSSSDGSTWEAWKPTTSEAEVHDFDFSNLYNTTDTGLVAYLDMDETADNTCTGGEDACDSKNSNDATFYNGETIATNSGVFTNGRLLDGTNDYGQISDDNTLDFTNATTIEAWIKPDDTIDTTNSFSSWTSVTAPASGFGLYDVSGVDAVIVANKIYYAAYLHVDTTETFYTANSNLDGSSFSGWTSQTAPNGAGDGETTSVAIDSDGTNLYYAALANDAGVEAFYTTSSNLAGTSFTAWTTQTAPNGANTNNGSSVDLKITNGKMYLATYLNGTDSVPTYSTYFAVANANLDGSSFSGWTALTDPVAPGYADAASVGLETDGNKLYYFAFTFRDAVEYLRTGYSDMDGLNFSGWTTQTAPNGTGINDHAYGDMTLAGGRLYMAAHMHDDTTVVYQTANMNLDGTSFSGWTTQTGPAITTANRSTTTTALTTDGKKIYHIAYAHADATSADVKIATDDLTYHPIFSKADAYELIQTDTGFILDWAGRPYSFGEKAAKHNAYYTVQPGRWTHVAISHDGTNLKFYVDGHLTRTETTSVDFASNANALKVGSDGTGYFKGTIDEVRLYSSAQTAATISTHHLAMSSQPDNLFIKPDTVIKSEGTSSLSLAAGRPQVSGNTLALWHLDETNGDNAGVDVFDSSSNSYHGEFNGTDIATNPVDGPFGKARQFNGTDDYIATTDGANFSLSQYTISAWVYRTSDSGTYEMIFDNRDADNDGIAMYVGTTDLLTCAHNADGLAAATTALGVGKWYYLTCTQDGSSLKAYVNGTIETTDTTSTSTTSESTNALIGARSHTSQTYFFPGYIDEVTISNTADSAFNINEKYRAGSQQFFNYDLTATDLSSKDQLILNIAADQPGTYLQAYVGESGYVNYQPDANTIAFWHLDDTYYDKDSTNVIKDSSSNGYDGVLDGASSVQGQIGSARRFTGANDISFGDVSIVDGASNLTLDAWVYPTAQTATTHFRLFNENLVLYLGQYGDQISLYMGNGAAWTNTSVTLGTLPINTWSHVSWVKSGTSAYVYLNGQMISSMVAPTVLGTSAGANYLSSFDGATQPWTGMMDEVRISNIARTATEIRQTYEAGRRTHNINIEFKATLDSGNLIANTSDLSFTIDSTSYGANSKGEDLYVGDKIIVKENVNGTEYVAQADVSSITLATGVTTVSSWDAGSTVPSGGFTTKATVYKWQKQYLDISHLYSSEVDSSNILTLRTLNPNKGVQINVDYLQSNTNYLNNPYGSSITSTANRYFQYRTLFLNNDTKSSAQLTSVQLDYNDNLDPSATSFQTTYLPNNVKTSDTTPEIRFSATDNESDNLVYQVQWYTDADFGAASNATSSGDTGFANVTTPADTSPFNAGNIISYTFQSALTNNITYFYRVRAMDIYNQYGEWSEVRSLTIDTSLSNYHWYQTHADQFIQNATVSGTISIDHTNNYVYLDGGVTATMRSQSIVATSFNTNSASWGSLIFTDDETYGDIKYQIYYDNTGTPTIIPDVTLAGNSTGFDTSPVDLSGVSTTTYPTIYLVANFTNDTGIPKLNDWEITLNSPPTVPTSLETEAQTNPSYITDSTPEFSAIYNDPDTSDYANYYQIEVNTFPDFTGTVMWNSTKTSMAQLAKGARSALISYAGTSLDVAKTYYWRIKFWDLGGEASPWSTESAYFTTPNLKTPSYCKIAETTDDSQLTVNWTDDNSTEDNYFLEKNTNGAGFVSFQTLAADSTSYADSVVSQPNDYAYRVKAVDGDFSTPWCSTDTLDLQSGNFNFEGLNFQGVDMD